MVWPAQSPDLNPIEHLWLKKAGRVFKATKGDYKALGESASRVGEDRGGTMSGID